MGEQGIKRLITVFAEAMSRVASRHSRVSRAIGDDTKADGAMKNPISAQSLNLHTFQPCALKCAKLKGKFYILYRRLPHFSVENSLFSFFATTKIQIHYYSCFLTVSALLSDLWIESG